MMNSNGNFIFLSLLFLLVFGFFFVLAGTQTEIVLIENLPFVGDLIIPTLWIGIAALVLGILMGFEPMVIIFSLAIIVHFYWASGILGDVLQSLVGFPIPFM